MATFPGGREKLRDYLTQTITRLQQSRSMDLATLKSKVMPSVVASIEQMSSNAPLAAQEEFREALTGAGILPNYEADITAFEEALQQILASVQKSIGNSASHHGEPDAVEGSPLENAAGQSQKVERDAQNEHSAAAEPTGDGGRGQKLLHDYVKKIMLRLDDPTRRGPEMSDVEFTSNVLPQISSSLQRLSSHAPADFRVAFARILVTKKLWPHLPVGMDPAKSHLPSVPHNGGVDPPKSRVHDALKQVNSLMQHVIHDSSDAYVIGLTSPVRVDVSAISGNHVANIPVEGGTSVRTLRNIVAAFLNCPIDTLALVQGEHEMGDEEVLTSDCQLTLVSGDGASLAGIYAGYSCNLLSLHPNGQTSALWCDDYWQPSREEEDILNRPIRDHPDVKKCVANMNKNAQTYGDEADVRRGSWKVANMGLLKVVSGTAYDPYLDNLFTFKFDVKYDQHFSEGISAVVLDGVTHNHFSFRDPNSKASEKASASRYYLVSSLAMPSASDGSG